PLTKLRRKLDEIEARDFFHAPNRGRAEEALAALEAVFLRLRTASATPLPTVALDALQSRTWVTRKGIHVDRMACAWLIRRFIDPAATLRFVDPKGYSHQKDELRFDMFEGEFTHEGDLCSFEVLLRRAQLEDPALQVLAELIHDLDLKEDRYGRPEMAGLGRLITGICQTHREDEARLERGSAVFDDLYAAFSGPGKTR
ncbi:MAG TPA: chromate resistance protein ChrB domain-containing protein, partial [Holophagaceae bacterium]|nr:chromate resistance protein ChrB domain-containing protein [Holophagaceae bacterium]